MSDIAGRIPFISKGTRTINTLIVMTYWLLQIVEFSTKVTKQKEGEVLLIFSPLLQLGLMQMDQNQEEEESCNCTGCFTMNDTNVLGYF